MSNGHAYELTPVWSAFSNFWPLWEILLKRFPLCSLTPPLKKKKKQCEDVPENMETFSKHSLKAASRKNIAALERAILHLFNHLKMFAEASKLSEI